MTARTAVDAIAELHRLGTLGNPTLRLKAATEAIELIGPELRQARAAAIIDLRNGTFDGQRWSWQAIADLVNEPHRQTIERWAREYQGANP